MEVARSAYVTPKSPTAVGGNFQMENIFFTIKVHSNSSFSDLVIVLPVKRQALAMVKCFF